MTISPWFTIQKPHPSPRLRLFCFPYAGVGPVVYRNWYERLPAEIEILALHLPGRESRMREQPIDSMSHLIDHLTAAILPFLDQPFAFFGHSLGGLIAFELTRALRSQSATLPVHLYVSSRRAPHLPDPYPPIHTLDNPAFVQKVQQRYNGIPQVILSDPDLLDLFLPTLRADFSILETYRYHAEPALEVPITACLGLNDPGITLEEIAAWQLHTGRTFQTLTFPGDHFYLQTHRDALLDALTADLVRFL